MRSWTVYEHISPSGKVYVGITTNIKHRWAANGYYYHLSDTIFSRALNKYGWDNFIHKIILDGQTEKAAKYTEKYLIRWYKIHHISYNTTDGGDGFAGKHSEEHVRNIVKSRIANNTIDYLVIDKDFNYMICSTEQEAATYLKGSQKNIGHLLRQPIGYTFRKHYLWKHEKGTPVDIEAIKNQIQQALAIRKQKMSEHGKTIGHLGSDKLRQTIQSMTSEERKAKYGHGEKRLGTHHSEETKRKISAAAKGRDMSNAIEARKKVPYNPTNIRPVIQYMITGEFIKEFSSIIQASIETNTNAKGISNCLSGRAATSGGYKWQYKN